MTPDATSAFLSTWGYPAYVVLFVLTAVGSPLTEDLLLLVGGYLVGTRVFAWVPTLVTAYAGVVGADVVLYGYGRKLRVHSLRRGFIRRLVRPGRLRLATRWFARFGDWLVVGARFVPGTRVLVFVSAGLRGTPLWRFLLLDMLAAALWVPGVLWLGAQFGEQIGSLNRTVNVVTDRVVLIALILVLAYLLRALWLRRERAIVGSPDSEP